MTYFRLIIGFLMVFVIISCKINPPDSDEQQQKQNEVILSEATSKVGMPAIKNFRERRLLKEILEMRDQANIITYTYLFSEMNGEYKFFCQSIGYGLPYATQYTNPQKPLSPWHESSIIAQADPNGLFSPTSATSTWVLCANPKNPKEIKPLYVEPLIIVSPFPLHELKVEVTK